ncbi:class I SAM-dependent methyltransferase [Kineococcus terrestris]|uniref:class I SAM-dependent methyltransferase n=1 Tax=Kineococcus terrestris TaxID=2044856 RepID=UPI0034DB73EF
MSEPPHPEEAAVAWRSAPWGRLRHTLVEHTLAVVCRTVSGRPLRVLDVGCGDGSDAVALARTGAEVTALDSAPLVLERARAAARRAGVADRVRAVQADLGDVVALTALTGGGGGTFDLVLCHDVLQHRPHAGSPEGLAADVAALASRVRPGGCLSVLGPGTAAAALRAAVREDDLRGARRLLAGEDAAGADGGVPLPAGRVEEALAAAGTPVEFRFGVRVVTDLLPDARKGERGYYEDLLALERALCERPELVPVARSWQLVGRRRPPRRRAGAGG